MPGKHANLGPSSAHRWMPCPGSVRLILDLPPEVRDAEASVYAQEGTVAHAVAAQCLAVKNDIFTALEGYVGTEIDGFTVDEDMKASLHSYLYECVMRSVGNTKSWIELRLNLDRLNPPQPMYGTADFVTFNPETLTLDIVDLKYGRGVVVAVENNPQLLYYALGAVLAIEEEVMPDLIKTIRMTIVQPRAEHPDGTVRTYEIDILELIAFACLLKRSAVAALQPDAPLVAGTHCRWCPAAGMCSAQAKHASEVAQSDFAVGTDLVPRSVDFLTVEEQAWILTQIPTLESWIKDLRQHVTRLLENGADVPGFKLVARRANRKWVDEAMLEEWANKADISDTVLFEHPKVRSVAQLEKRLGKKVIPDALITKPDAGVTLAPESDARPSADPRSDFTALPPAQETVK